MAAGSVPQRDGDKAIRKTQASGGGRGREYVGYSAEGAKKTESCFGRGREVGQAVGGAADEIKGGASEEPLIWAS